MNVESVVAETEEYQQSEPQEVEQVEEVQAEEEQPAFQMPERFEGKSAEDIVNSYLNLEDKMKPQGAELGELRPLKQYADSLLQQQAKPEPQVEVEEPDFFDDPSAAVQRAIENDPTIQQMREQTKLQQQQSSQQKFAGAHPDYMDVVQDRSFQEWVSESPIRVQLFQQANANYNFDAGNELLTNWKDRKMISKTQEVEAAKEENRKNGLKAGKGVSKSSGESTAGKKIYRRADLIRLKQTDPAKYDTLADEIYQAYQEGRVK